MEAIVNQIHKSLLKKGKTLAVAESCTGGQVSWLLTKQAGSSQYFKAGLVAYSNKIKEDFLKIPCSVIAKNGAVCRLIAELMARGIRKTAKTDLAIGITGIAGPEGGTPAKPVGTVFIAIESKDKRVSKQFRFSGSRAAIRKKAALESLKLLKKLI